jgi:DNA invertase Pin-like site-specific DNA recombinase
LSRILEAGADVRFADLPQIEGPTGKFILQQMASVAELEAGLISKRTRDALAAAKRNGKRLGGRRAGAVLTAAAQAAGRAKQSARSERLAADLAPMLNHLKGAGIVSLAGIARALTERGIPTPRGLRKWTAMQVKRVLTRAR